MTPEERLTSVAREVWRRDDLIVQLDPPCVYNDNGYEAFDPTVPIKPHPRLETNDSPEARMCVAMDSAIQRLLDDSQTSP